jgi:hypothetical protein
LSQRYTFRTTRKTKWLDAILQSVEDKDRSDFIREHLILGLKAVGYSQGCQTDVPQMSDKQQTIVEPMSNQCHTIVEPVVSKETVEEDEDLDNKLLEKF